MPRGKKQKIEILKSHMMKRTKETPQLESMVPAANQWECKHLSVVIFGLSRIQGGTQLLNEANPLQSAIDWSRSLCLPL